MWKRAKRLIETNIELVCDMCGASCGIDGIFEYSILSADWGYYSSKDCQKWEAHFCEKCSEEIRDFVRMKGGLIRIESNQKELYSE